MTKESFFIIGSILVVISALLCSGCLSAGGPDNIPKGQGISDNTPRDQPGPVSLAEAIAGLNISRNGEVEGVPVLTYYIKGEDLDINGSAKTWVIAARQESRPFFFIYNARGTTVIPASTELPLQEIHVNTLLQPEDLFRQHRLLIQDITKAGTIPIKELEVYNGNYTLEVKSQNITSILLFDAITGKEQAAV